MDEYPRKPLSSSENSARTCLVAAAVLLVSGTVVISPTAGVAAIVLAALVASIGVCLGYRRFGKAGLALVIAAIVLTAWRLPDAQDEYGRYLDRVLEKSR